jgi:hypothetical protein
MAIIGNGISLRGLAHNDFQYGYNLASGIVKADVGKAVSLDASAANTAKLAADGDFVIGRLLTVEDRTVEGTLVGTVETHGGFRFTKTAAAVAIGDTVVGAGDGEVKAAATANHADNYVVEVDGDLVTIVR